MTSQASTSGLSSSGASTQSLSLSQQASADFNGDGRSDILWKNSNGDAGVWLIGSGVNFTPIDFGINAGPWTLIGSGNFNGDGKADLLWRNSNGDIGQWLSNAGSGYTGYTAVDLQNVPTTWTVQGVGNFAGAGNSDILWQNTSSNDVGIWFPSSQGGYTAFDLGVVGAGWAIQGVGDFNGDGKSDILWRNTTTGQVGEWLSNAGSGYTGFTPVVIQTVDSSWVIQGVGDYTGSGKSDILWRNTNGDVGLWVPSSQGGYTAIDVGVIDTAWTIQSVGDFNGDGKADVLWRRSDGTVGDWLSTSGTGFTGFTAQSLAVVPSNWSIVGNNPSLGGIGAAAAQMSHAMASMGAGSGAAGGSTPMAHPNPMQPVLVTPAIHTV